MRSYGFSLVELSIVLVILGLLTGGILSGQSLIRAAEIRSAVTEYSTHITSIQTFRDKYMAIPGDFRDATKFWGKDASACNAHTGTAQAGGTCNGNGDGRINEGTATNATAEAFQLWKHLSLAGLIEGTYSGLTGPTSCCTPVAYVHAVQGGNVPSSKISNGGWSVRGLAGYYAGSTAQFAGTYDNYFILGSFINGGPSYNPLLTPEEAWNIDTKVDDGKPAQGKVFLYRWANCSTATSAGSVDAEYNVSYTSKDCTLIFPRAF